MANKINIGDILALAVNTVRSRPIWSLFLALRSVFLLVVAVFGMLYIGFHESEKTSGQLSDDFLRLNEPQSVLLSQMTRLTNTLTDPTQSIDLEAELLVLRANATDTLSALGGFRSPTTDISDARTDYQRSLEELLGVTSRLQRGEIEGMGPNLHNSLQSTVNNAGLFRREVENFQGSAWTRTIGSLL